MQMARSKAHYFAGFKGHQPSLKGASFETGAGALNASRSHFICDQNANCDPALISKRV